MRQKHANISDIATNLATRSVMTLIHVLQLFEFVLSFSDLGTKQPGPEPHRKIDNPICFICFKMF